MKYELIMDSPLRVAERLNASPNIILEAFEVLDEGNNVIALLGSDPDIKVQHTRRYFSLELPVGQPLSLSSNQFDLGTKCILSRKGPRFLHFIEEWDFLPEAESDELIEEYNFAFSYTAADQKVVIDNFDFPEWPVVFVPYEGLRVRFNTKAEADAYEWVPLDAGSINASFYSKNFGGYVFLGFPAGSDYTTEQAGQASYQPRRYLDEASLVPYFPNGEYSDFDSYDTVHITGGLRSVSRRLEELPDVKGSAFTISLAREKPSYFVITVYIPSDMGQ
jgi:hypothetical protein